MKNDPALQSSGEAVAESPGRLLNPALSRALRGAEPARRMVSATIYRKGGNEQGEQLQKVVREAVAAIGAERAVRITMYRWLPWAVVPMIKGARRHPILEIAGSVYSEGTVPDIEALKQHLRTLLMS